MSKLVTERNTGAAGQLPATEAQAKLTKRYANGLKVARGVDIVPGEGIRPGKGPGQGSFAFSPIQYRADLIRGSFHLRNSTIGVGLDNPFFPLSDSGSEGPPITSALSSALSQGNFRARFDPADGANYYDFLGGRVDMNKTTLSGGGAITPAIPSGTIVSVVTPFKYYRGMRPGLRPGVDGSLTVPGWSMVGTFHGWWTKHTGFTSDSGNDYYTVLCRGSAPQADDHGSGFTGLAIPYGVDVHGTTSLTEFVIQPGVYLVTQDIYLIGDARMFTKYPLAAGVNNAFQGTAIIYRANNFSVTVSASMAIGSLDAADQHWVLGYGAIDDPGGGGIDTGTAEFTRTLQTVTSTSFWFKGRTVVVGERRFGRASLDASEIYLGASAIGDGTDRDTAPVLDSAAYAVALDSGLVWLESNRLGIVLGTATAEYVLENIQVKGQLALQKISNVGTSALPNDLMSVSATLEGNVYFLSNYGLTTLPFSQEAQAYLPHHFKFEGLATGHPTALAASFAERCLYVTFTDETLWKIWPETGAIAQVNVPDNPSKLRGVVSRDGAVFCVFSEYSPTDASYIGDYFAKANEVRVGQSVVETTAFGRAPDTRARIVEISLDLVATKGGTYEVAGSAKPARPIPYTQPEADLGATGTKRIRPVSIVSKPGDGQGVRLTFAESEEFQILAVTAVSEVM